MLSVVEFDNSSKYPLTAECCDLNISLYFSLKVGDTVI